MNSNTTLSLEFDSVMLDFPEGFEKVAHDIFAAPKKFDVKFEINLATEEHDGIPIDVYIFTDLGLIRFELSKQQAIVLGQFLTMAKHVKEPE